MQYAKAVFGSYAPLTRITIATTVLAHKLRVDCYLTIGEKENAFQAFEAFEQTAEGTSNELYQKLSEKLEKKPVLNL